MNKNDIVSQWSNAIDNDSFLTAKHDPTGLSITWDTFRTVLAPDAAESLPGFIKSGNYGVNVYQDSKFPTGSGFFEIAPSGEQPFDIAGSGVSSGSLTPSGDYDRLVIVHGAEQGWHIYAEQSGRISAGVNNGRLTLEYEL